MLQDCTIVSASSLVLGTAPFDTMQIGIYLKRKIEFFFQKNNKRFGRMVWFSRRMVGFLTGLQLKNDECASFRWRMAEKTVLLPNLEHIFDDPHTEEG